MAVAIIFGVGDSMDVVTLSISNMQVVVHLTTIKGVIEYRYYNVVSCVMKSIVESLVCGGRAYDLGLMA